MDIDYKKDYYKLLTIPQYATKEEIEIAYRSQIKVFHPDNVSCVENLRKEYANKFIEIQEAYEILSNEQLRKIYDSQRQKYIDTNESVKYCNNIQHVFPSNFWEKQSKACDNLYKDNENKIHINRIQPRVVSNDSSSCGCLIVVLIIIVGFCFGFFFL